MRAQQATKSMTTAAVPKSRARRAFPHDQDPLKTGATSAGSPIVGKDSRICEHDAIELLISKHFKYCVYAELNFGLTYDLSIALGIGCRDDAKGSHIPDLDTLF